MCFSWEIGKEMGRVSHILPNSPHPYVPIKPGHQAIDKITLRSLSRRGRQILEIADDIQVCY